MWHIRMLFFTLLSYLLSVDVVYALCADLITPCAAGEYYNSCPNISCLPCEPGQYCDGGCVSPQPCAKGTFRASYGAASAVACDTCPDGFFNVIQGGTNCTGCPLGHQCSDKTIVPSICPRGSYATPYSTTCTACPIGSYNTAAGSGYVLLFCLLIY